MTFSVIIVNYNVKYFLEHCLLSVKKAITQSQRSLAIDNFDVEVIVVDNLSSDGSLEYLSPKFSWVHFLANEANIGFGAANNRAIGISRGRFILFLNPDTILPEDFFEKVYKFLVGRAYAGAVGVHMIDGAGRYLRESKRGFPTAWVSFCKMSGLTAMFPHSRLLAGYYMGHLDESENCEVDALSGACMVCRKEALDKTGGFDERFFMYAEDIDLSYRIQKAGFKNYYFQETGIIHFKGESTRKDQRYVKMFYKSMVQFVNKHYNGSFQVFIRWGLGLAIWIRSLVPMIAKTFAGKERNADRPECLFYLQGDESSAAMLRQLLGNTIVNEKSRADWIVFCEGPEYGYGQIIADYPGTGKAKMIYSSNSGSVIGSKSSGDMGVAIGLIGHS